MIKGIDISHHNTSIDWINLKKNDIEFVYIKHSQGVGLGGIDNMFSVHFSNAKAAGLKVGLYHFATLNSKDEINDAKQEAEFFLEQTKHIDTDLIPMLDVETNEVDLDKNELEAWIETYYQALGEKCMLYSSAGFLNSYLEPTHKLGRIPLWLSSYPIDKANQVVTEELFYKLKQPKPPVGWTEWQIWQWTAKGKINGATGLLDLNFTNKLPIIEKPAPVQETEEQAPENKPADEAV